jgi:hypothetical protein
MMARKAKNTAAKQTPAEKESAFMERLAISPLMNAAALIQLYGVKATMGEIDFLGMAGVLLEKTEKVTDGDTKGIEAMLINQAYSLQAIFTNMAQRAAKAERMDSLERLMRMALKSQNQCRTTLETLANIKNPPVVFARQANIAHGHQQINNGEQYAQARTHAGENNFVQNELLEDGNHGNHLDTGATGATISGDKAMATVGEINGGENAGRESQISKERL